MASVITASSREVLGGRVLPPREGASRVHATSGMSREATPGLGGRQTPGAMESVYTKAKSGQAAPGMRGAIRRACASLAAESFVKDLDRDASLADGSALGADRVACASAWPQRFVYPRRALGAIGRAPDPGKFHEHPEAPYTSAVVIWFKEESGPVPGSGVSRRVTQGPRVRFQDCGAFPRSRCRAK